MFDKNLKVFTVFGVPVSVNITFLAVIAFIVLINPASLPIYAILIPSILIHEFGHILTARAFGSNCTGVFLHVFGGAAFIEKAQSTREELLVSLAGPATSLILGILFLILYEITGVYILGMACVLNLVLAAFNMIPAYPMDGGRVLKSSLSYIVEDSLALKIAVYTSFIISIIGLVVSVLFSVYTLLILSLFVAYINYQEWSYLK